MMASENENEKRETLADIVAEYRNDADAMDNGELYQPTTEYVRRLLDRIEAAWKRERDRLMTGPRSWEECVERAMKVKENSDVLY
jgi:hypothetical protein